MTASRPAPEARAAAERVQQWLNVGFEPTPYDDIDACAKALLALPVSDSTPEPTDEAVERVIAALRLHRTLVLSQPFGYSAFCNQPGCGWQHREEGHDRQFMLVAHEAADRHVAEAVLSAVASPAALTEPEPPTTREEQT